MSAAVGEDIFPEELSEGDLVFDVRIDQLHGTADGEARLVAYWIVQRKDEILASYQFSETTPLRADGYGALARAQKALLSDLSKRIATSLEDASGD